MDPIEELKQERLWRIVGWIAYGVLTLWSLGFIVLVLMGMFHV